jgi:hypothetical protein
MNHINRRRTSTARRTRKALSIIELLVVIMLLAFGLGLTLPALAKRTAQQQPPTASLTLPSSTLTLEGDELVLSSEGITLQRLRVLSRDEGPTYARVLARCEFSVLSPALTGTTLRMLMKETPSTITLAYAPCPQANTAWPRPSQPASEGLIHLRCTKQSLR